MNFRSAINENAKALFQSALSVLAVGGALYILYLAVRYYYGDGTIQRHHLESAWIGLVVLYVLLPLSRQPTMTSTSQPDSLFPRFWHATYGFLLCAIVTFIVYCPALTLGLFSDDFTLAEWVNQHEFWSRQGWEYMRPVPLLAWWATFAMFGPNPIWLHVLNLTLHSLNASLIVLLARRAGLKTPAAILAGLLFVNLPLLVEPVVWPSGSHDLWMTAGSLSFVIVATESSWSWRVGLGGAFALLVAVLSKETGVVAPVLAGVMWLRGFRSLRFAGMQMALAGLAVSGGYALWRMLHRQTADVFALPPSRYGLKEIIVRPFASLGAPWSSAVVESWPVVALFSVCLVVTLILWNEWDWTASQSGYRRAIRLVAWILVAVLPIFPFIFVSPMLEGTRYLYLPACGWVILLASLMETAWDSLGQHRAVGMAASASILCMWSVGVHWHLRPWQHAVQVRDQIMREAQVRLDTTKCETVFFDAIPGSLDGAHVFGNGFEESLRLGGQSTRKVRIKAEGSECQFRWNGATFVQSASFPR